MFNRSSISRLALTASLTLAIGMASAATASAVTVGQVALAPPAASDNCTGAFFDITQPTVTSGTSYVVPAGGQQITSWTTFAGAGAGQKATLKVFRLVNGTTYKQVAHDGPRDIIQNVSQTYATSVLVQPGDLIGLSNAKTAMACTFSVPGETNTLVRGGTAADIKDGDTAAFGTLNPGRRLNLSVQVTTSGKTSSNDFSLGKVKKNKNKGTALLTVDVPGPGTVTLGGAGIKAQRSTGGAAISKEADTAGPVTLKIKAKGAKKAKLADTGKVKVKAKVTFTPTNGTPSTETKTVKLIDK